MNTEQFQPLDEIVWQGKDDRIVFSPRDGGRIVSWKHGERGELVKPLGVTDGASLRVLFGEEKYPGTSYVTPHLARVLRNDESGFSVHLRHHWNASNAIARLIGWEDKVNPSYLDGLLLDKIVTFDAGASALQVEITITNLTGEARYITPWLQNQFYGWVQDAFVVIGGKKQPYLCHDAFWDGHRPTPGKPMRLVHSNREGSFSIVLGAETEWLAGMASLTHEQFGEGSKEGCMELRGRTITLAPSQCWRANAFLAPGDGVDAWQRWATDAPQPLSSRIEDTPHPALPKGRGEQPRDTRSKDFLTPPGERTKVRGNPRTEAEVRRESNWDAASLLPLLQHWALPDEKSRGLMVLSHLDKVPFTSAKRYSAANSFSDFHLDAIGQSARASIFLFPLRELESIKTNLRGAKGWRVVAERGLSIALRQHEPANLTLEGPADLAGKGSVEVQLSVGVTLRVEPDARVAPRYPYQVKQVTTYLDERWQAEKSGFHGSTPEEFKEWQTRTRRRYLKWVNDSVTGPAPLEPRLMERQIGPRCLREKILIQTEPGVWVPAYLIRPKNAPTNARLPAILFLHGSCPGKLSFAPDETLDMYDTGDRWPSAYQLAHELGCVVLIPDLRGFGEWWEANHGHRWQRAWRAGYDVTAMMVWDQMRAVDYLLQRADVDASRILSMGSSGGGRMTLFLMAADERVAGGIVSSWTPTSPTLPDQYFYQSYPERKHLNHLPAELAFLPHTEDERESRVAINPPPQLSLAPATMLSLAAPRVVWVMDGTRDECVLPSLPTTAEEKQTIFARWRAAGEVGREEIANAYRVLGAEKNYCSSWFDGGHLAGFTFNNIAGWLKQHFQIGKKCFDSPRT